MRARRTSEALLAGILLLALGGAAAFAQTTQEIFEVGVRAFEAHDFAKAERAFSALVQRDPSATNFYYLAAAEVAAGNLKQAITDFEESIQHGNRSAAVHYNLGLAYLRNHQPAAGVRELQRTLALDSHYVPAQYALGVVLLESGQAREASTYLKNANEASPHDPRVWASLAKAQFEAGDSKQAIETTENAVQALPDDIRLAVTLANVCIEYRQIQTARNLLEDANGLAPEDTEVRLLLAKTSLLAGEPVEALAVLKGMPDNAGPTGERLLLMGEARALTGNFSAAEVDLTSAVKQSPRNARYLSAYAWLEQVLGRYQKAISALAKARVLDPQSPFIPYRTGVSYYFLNQLSKARQSCEETLRFAPHYSAAYLLLGLIELKQKNFQAAAADLRRSIALDPQEALSHRELGLALFQANDRTAGKKEMDRALALNPKDPVTYFWRAKLLASQGVNTEAINDLNAAVTLNPNYSEAWSELAALYNRVGRPQQAAAVLAKLKKIKASAQSPDRNLLLRSLPDATH